MFDKYKYTDKEIKQILNSIVILVDTREQKNQNISSWFDSKKIKHKKKSLSYGDYSFYVPANEELHIPRDVLFTNDICIERKNSTDEIVSNFAQDRNRIEDEFLRHKGKMILLVEDEQFYKNICNGSYKSNYKKQSAVATYHTFIERYGLCPAFVHKEYAGYYIYMTFRYYLRNYLKK